MHTELHWVEVLELDTSLTAENKKYKGSSAVNLENCYLLKLAKIPKAVFEVQFQQNYLYHHPCCHLDE